MERKGEKKTQQRCNASTSANLIVRNTHLAVAAAVDTAVEVIGAAETAGFRLSEKLAVAAVVAGAKTQIIYSIRLLGSNQVKFPSGQ